MNHPATILIIAFALDLLIGDPTCPLHPVRLFGKLIQTLEKMLRTTCRSLRMASFLLPLLAVALSLGIYRLLLLLSFDVVWVINLLLTYSLLALKDLSHHAKAVSSALAENNLPLACARVQMIVGRDAGLLDDHGIARAAIESVAENFVDGFLSPVFWYTAGALLFGNTGGGVALLIVFKVISTLDSMVGYKNECYLVLGRISAQLDDVMNFIPARLSIPLIALSARLISKDWKSAWRIGLRDRLKHASPNSAHAEAAVAGALGLRLGGPTAYPHGTVEKPWLGDGKNSADAKEINKAVRLLRICGIITLLVSVSALFYIF